MGLAVASISTSDFADAFALSMAGVFMEKKMGTRSSPNAEISPRDTYI